MTNITSLVLLLVLLAVVVSAAYWAVRKGVAHGIRDARRAEDRTGA